MFHVFGYNGFRFGFLSHDIFDTYEDAKQFILQSLSVELFGDNNHAQGYIVTTANTSAAEYMIAKMFLFNTDERECLYSPTSGWTLCVANDCIAMYEKH